MKFSARTCGSLSESWRRLDVSSSMLSASAFFTERFNFRLVTKAAAQLIFS
jgi:hypothetical protein